MIYNFVQMNSLALAIVVVLLAAGLIGGLMWVSWHPHPRVF
jgi:hypothetical protein